MINFDFDLGFLDKFLFHNCRPQVYNIAYLNDAFNFYEKSDFDNENRELNFDDKINVWYVRDDKGCNDYVYNDNLESIQRAFPKEIVPKINNNKILLILSTDVAEWQYDDFWRKVIDYCESIGIDKSKINIMNSNVSTSISNSYTFTMSGLAPTYDLGITLLDKYPDKFPYNTEVVKYLRTNNKQKRYNCLNAHYSEHRHYIVYKLFEEKLNDMGYISFTLGQGLNHVEHPKERMIFEWNRFIDPLLLKSSGMKIKNYQDSVDFVNKLPIFVKEFDNDEPRKFWDKVYQLTNEEYRKYMPYIRPWMLRDLNLVDDTYFCISTETLRDSDNGNMCHFAGAVMLGWVLQPTIIVGTSGIIKHLKSLGFESYDELFDESYDEIVETDKRLLKVWKEVERVCRMPEDKLKSIYNDLLPKVIHNQNKIFEYSVIEDWKNILTKIGDIENV